METRRGVLNPKKRAVLGNPIRVLASGWWVFAIRGSLGVPISGASIGIWTPLEILFRQFGVEPMLNEIAQFHIEV